MSRRFPNSLRNLDSDTSASDMTLTSGEVLSASWASSRELCVIFVFDKFLKQPARHSKRCTQRVLFFGGNTQLRITKLKHGFLTGKFDYQERSGKSKGAFGPKNLSPLSGLSALVSIQPSAWIYAGFYQLPPPKISKTDSRGRSVSSGSQTPTPASDSNRSRSSTSEQIPSSGASSSTPVSQSSAKSPVSSGHPRLSVPSLLCDSADDPERSSLSYGLEVVQQPHTAAEFGTRYLSRLPLAPPLIVQLLIKDQVGNPVNEEIELSFFVAHLTLLSADGQPLDTIASPDGRLPAQRGLYGTLISSPHYLRNLQGKKGIYFLFPDVSIRWRGRYQLAVSLIRISRDDSTNVVCEGERGTVLTEVHTLPFEVVSHTGYIAPAQTRLSQYFVEQGARMYAFASSVQNDQLFR